MFESRKLSDREKVNISDFRQALLSESLQSKMINFAMSLTKCNEAFSMDLIQQTYLKAMENELVLLDEVERYVQLVDNQRVGE